MNETLALNGAKRTRDVLVEISFLLGKHGGRDAYVTTGYRPQFFYNNHDWDAEHEYIGVDRVEPGQTVQAYLCFLSPHEHFGILKVSDHFLIREGNKVVAFGHVLEILDLEVSSKVGQNA